MRMLVFAPEDDESLQSMAWVRMANQVALGPDCMALLNQNASPERLMEELAGAKVVFFLTHGEDNERRPGDPGSRSHNPFRERAVLKGALVDGQRPDAIHEGNCTLLAGKSVHALACRSEKLLDYAISGGVERYIGYQVAIQARVDWGWVVHSNKQISQLAIEFAETATRELLNPSPSSRKLREALACRRDELIEVLDALPEEPDGLRVLIDQLTDRITIYFHEEQPVE